MILLILVIATRDSIASILNTLWVDPIASKMYDDGTAYFTALLLILLAFYIISFYKERYIAKFRVGAIIIAFIIYLLTIVYNISLQSPEWRFSSFASANTNFLFLYHTTWIFIAAFIGEVTLYFKRRNLKNKDNLACSFIYEKPISDNLGDSYRRNKYCKIIASKITNNFHCEGSFVIGVSGSWGYGKTSFLN